MRKLTAKECCLLKFKRKELGLTIGVLADHLLMSKSNLSRIENGKIMVSDDNMRLLENYFSINFSLDEDIYESTQKKLNTIAEDLIFYRLFGNNWDIFEGHSIKITSSIAYPIYMLARLLVYTTKNVESYFVEKYLPIFESVYEFLDEKNKQSISLIKLNRLYFSREYESALKFCEDEYSKYMGNILYDSYVVHIKAILYNCTNNQATSYRTIDKAISLSDKLENFQRLIALNILRTCNLRQMHRYIDGLLGDLGTLKYANEHEIHHYDYTIYCNIAWSYYLLGNYKLATKYYSLAEQIDMDDDICFYSALSYWRLGNRKKCKEYVIKGRKARNVGLSFPYLLDWLELTLNKKYSIRAEKRLLYCLNKFELVMQRESKNCIYQLLVEHYEHTGNKKRSDFYYKKYQAEIFSKKKHSEDLMIKS